MMALTNLTQLAELYMVANWRVSSSGLYGVDVFSITGMDIQFTDFHMLKEMYYNLHEPHRK